MLRSTDFSVVLLFPTIIIVSFRASSSFLPHGRFLLPLHVSEGAKTALSQAIAQDELCGLKFPLKLLLQVLHPLFMLSQIRGH